MENGMKLKRKNVAYELKMTLAYVTLNFAFINCGGFNVDPNAGIDRQTFFKQRPVFGEGAQGNVTALPIDRDPTPSGRTSTSSASSSSENQAQSTGGYSQPTSNVILMCSYGLSSESETNALRENKTVYIGYREDVPDDQGAKLLCATVIDLNKVINDKNVALPSCPELTSGSGKPTLEITTKNQPVIRTRFSTISYFEVKGALTIAAYDEHGRGKANPKIWLLYALNDEYPILEPGFTNADYGDQSKCDHKVSPLFLQLAPKNLQAQQLWLSSPTTGIQFDILGDNARPTAHEKTPISWVLPQSRRDNYFLVLPSSSGGVSGIDEMFGDNTRGPDGKFAANGYEALRKYDGSNKLGGISSLTRDGVIDKDDAFFSRLRLWNDPNGDGIAQADELQNLSALGVKSIDLNYDPNYFEVDRYGNEVRLKSIVNMENGDVNLIYDLWFALKGT